MSDGEIKPMATFLGLIKVWVALGIVDELVMRQVMNAEGVGRCVNWKCGEPV